METTIWALGSGVGNEGIERTMKATVYGFGFT